LQNPKISQASALVIGTQAGNTEDEPWAFPCIFADQLNSIRVITQITCAWFVHLYVQRMCSAAQSATNTPSASKRSKDVACAKAATAWFRIQRCVGRRCLRDRALMITVERWLGIIRHNSLFSLQSLPAPLGFTNIHKLSGPRLRKKAWHGPSRQNPWRWKQWLPTAPTRAMAAHLKRFDERVGKGSSTFAHDMSSATWNTWLRGYFRCKCTGLQPLRKLIRLRPLDYEWQVIIQVILKQCLLRA